MTRVERIKYAGVGGPASGFINNRSVDVKGASEGGNRGGVPSSRKGEPATETVVIMVCLCARRLPSYIPYAATFTYPKSDAVFFQRENMGDKPTTISRTHGEGSHSTVCRLVASGTTPPLMPHALSDRMVRLAALLLCTASAVLVEAAPALVGSRGKSSQVPFRCSLFRAV